MSLLTSIAKWKLRWAVVSGVFTLIILPIGRLVFKRKMNKKTAGKHANEAVDVKAEEIK
jgi:hypothetical protein